MAFAMDLSQRKEQFSYGFLQATATAAGFWLSDPRVDVDSVDCTVEARGQTGPWSSPKLDVQLKCAARDDFSTDPISYSVRRKNYDDLRDSHRMVPIILALLLVPVDESRWMEHADSHWTSRYCCYWQSLEGVPAPPDSATSTTVHIPKSQLLTVAGLRRLMERISQERHL